MKKVAEVTVEVMLGLMFLWGFVAALATLWFILNLVMYADSGVQGPTLTFFQHHPLLLALNILSSPLVYLAFSSKVRENVLWRTFGQVCEFFF